MSAAVLALLMLVSAGCSGSSDKPADKAQSTGSSGSSSPGSGASQPPVDNGSVDSGIDTLHPPKPVASVTVPAPYEKDPKATARFDVYSIKRQGKLAILTLSVTPTFSTAKAATLFALMGNHGFRPTLVDPVNLREYRVVKSPSGLSTNDINVRAYSGGTMFVWAAFAAPPADVEKVNINLYDSLLAILDVPVQ